MVNRAAAPEPPVVVVVYEDAAEAVVYRTPDRQGESETVKRRTAVVAAEPVELEAPQADRSSTARRIRTHARRYAVANRCDQLVTCTYRDGHPKPCVKCGADRPVYTCRTCRDRVRQDANRFARRVRSVFGPIPLEYFLESHASGEVHVHFVAPRAIAKRERETRVLAGLWSRGFVDATPDRVRGESARERCRRSARYASKYAAKAVEGGELDPSERAYSTAHGFQPVVTRGRTWTMQAGELSAQLLLGEVKPPAYRFDSGDDPEWRGPPMVFMSW